MRYESTSDTSITDTGVFSFSPGNRKQRELIKYYIFRFTSAFWSLTVLKKNSDISEQQTTSICGVQRKVSAVCSSKRSEKFLTSIQHQTFIHTWRLHTDQCETTGTYTNRIRDDGDEVSPRNVVFFRYSDAADSPRRLHQIMSPRKFQIL
jgi:hypothetical protein